MNYGSVDGTLANIDSMWKSLGQVRLGSHLLESTAAKVRFGYHIRLSFTSADWIIGTIINFVNM